MTREELRRRFEAYARRGKFIGGGYLVFLLLACTVTVVTAVRAPKDDPSLAVVGFSTLIAAVLLSSVIVHFISRTAPKQPG